MSGGSGVGGVVGYVSGTSTISGCYNTGSIFGTTGYIGGVTGQHWRAGIVENCYNAGTVSGPATVGGFSGGHKAASTVLTNCFNVGDLTVTKPSFGSSSNYGPLIGATTGTCINCYFTKAISSDHDFGTMAEDLSAATLGSAFVPGDMHPVLAWESSVCTDTPVRPAFEEGTELSAELAEYIKEASTVKKRMSVYPPQKRFWEIPI